MNRQCPGCARASIPVSGLIVTSCECLECRAIVAVHWLYRSVFFVFILLVTIPSALAVLVQQGVYAAMLWVPFPVGALGYIKARFCPLEVKPGREDPRPHAKRDQVQ